jgi:UDP-arabinose 4-epimerase
MTQRILVTGGAGYIGSHACKALARAGYEPVAVDTLEAGYAWAVRWGPLEPVDVRDTPAMTDLIRRHRPAAVLHFAGSIQVGESAAKPVAYWDNNVGGLISLLRAMGRYDVPALVFSSTAAVYGDPETVPIPEDHPHRPISPYGASKAACERILRDAETAGGLRALSLRYFNAAGADPDAEIGEAHDPETHLIPNAVRAVMDPALTLDIYGRDFATRDGTAERDYVHVTDLAEAHAAALADLLDGGPGGALNVGTGTGATVQEVVDACAEALGQAPKVRRAARRAGDSDRLVADTGRAHARLAWRPTLSDLPTIVRTAAAWHTRHHGWGER